MIYWFSFRPYKAGDNPEIKLDSETAYETCFVSVSQENRREGSGGCGG